MKIHVLQEEFSKALNLASRFASSKAQLPVLANILLSAKKGKLSISSTNLEISTNIYIGAKVEDDGEITIPAKTITDIVSNLRNGQINLESEAESLKITSSDFESVISGMNSSDFPSIPKKIERIDLTLDKDVLDKCLSQVLFAVSVDETRPILTGVLISCQKGVLNIVATDGFRLSQRKLENKSISKNISAILPKSILNELTRFPSEGVIEFNFDKENNQTVFKSDNIILSSRVMEGEFPDYKKIVPKNFEAKVLIDKEDFSRAIKLASVFARDSANMIKLNIDKTYIQVSAESQLSGKQKTKIDANIEGQSLEIAFNFRFLEDLIQAIEGDDIKMEFSGASSPAVFTDPKQNDFLHLIMPVKLQD